MMNIDVKHACSFTGHRPERLEGLTEEKAIQWLEEEISRAMNDGYTDFISGMQRGVDLWAAEIVLRMKAEGCNVSFFGASAFRGMEENWEKEWQERYKNVFNMSDGHIFVCSRPGRKAFFERNEWMVDHSSRLIAVYTGAPGGTLETIKYARALEKEIIQIKTT